MEIPKQIKLNKDVILIPIDELKEYSNNSKSHPDSQIETIIKSITNFGFNVPILVDESNVIIAGHGRLLAAQKLGINNVPCIYLTGLSEAQKKQYRIMDNKSAESDWLFDKLKIDFDWLKDNKFDLDLTGFSFDEISRIIGKKEDDVKEIVPDDVETIETNIEIGDIFQIGKHNLICGDSTDYSNYSKIITKGVNLVFTSPPYNMGADMYEGYDDNYASEEYIKFNKMVASNCSKELNGFIFWNISYNKNARFEFIKVANELLNINKLKFMELIVWNKKSAMPIISTKMLTRQYEDIFVMGTEQEISDRFDLYYVGNTNERRFFNKTNKKALTNYWEITTKDSQLDNHKACFPVKLPARAILLTTQENEFVLDPFAGSGTTMLACEQLGRISLNIEMLPKYCQVIINRMRKLKPDIEVKCLNRDIQV